MNLPQNELSTVQDILSSGDRRKAQQWRDFGRFIAISFDATTSALFGYEFVRIVPTEAVIFGGVSVSGIVGGLACLGLTAGMARIWNVTQLQAAESEAQHNIAQGAYFGSVAVSLLMTVIYLAIAIFGLRSGLGAEWLMFGRIVITAVAIGQLIAWLWYERQSPQYQREMIRTITAARMQTGILDTEAQAVDLAREKVQQQLAPYVAPLANQMAAQAASSTLARLQYVTGELVELPPLPATADDLPSTSKRPATRMRPRKRSDVVIVRPPVKNGKQPDFLASNGGS